MDTNPLQLELPNVFTAQPSTLPTRYLPPEKIAELKENWLSHVAYSIIPPKGREPWILRFQEVGMMREKDRLTVEIKVRKTAVFSDINPFDQATLGITNPRHAIPGENGHVLKCLDIEIAPLILHVLEAIYLEADAYLTITSQRREYTKAAWGRAAKTMKMGLSGKVSIKRMLELQQEAMTTHIEDIAAYEATREKTNRAPVSREIANTSRLYQAADRGIPIELDGLAISAKEDWAKIHAAIQKAQEEGATDQVFAAAALQSEDYNGLEILALVCLIQIIREKAGLTTPDGPLQNKLDSFVIDPTELLTRLGLIGPSTNNTQKAREKARLSNALTSLARKMIKIAPAKKDAANRATIKGFRTGFFMFEEISANDGDNEAGSWKFTALDLLQVLTDDSTPFRPIPTDPFIYIAEHADPRYMDDIMRAAWDILLATSFAPQSRQTIALSHFDLTSGEGIPPELAKTKQAILTHALQRYTKGIAKIDSGILEYTPPAPEKTVSAAMEASIQKIAETAARKVARGEIRKASKKERR